MNARNTKGHDSRAIANLFMEQALKEKRPVTLMQLSKFVYIAHGWTLALLNKPLSRHRMEAWKYGPVIPEVYYAFRSQGINLKDIAKDKNGKCYSADFSADERSIIQQVSEKYGVFGAFALSNLTHEKGSPWDIAGNGGRRFYAPIDDELIKEHYREKYKRLTAESRRHQAREATEKAADSD